MKIKFIGIISLALIATSSMAMDRRKFNQHKERKRPTAGLPKKIEHPAEYLSLPNEERQSFKQRFQKIVDEFSGDVEGVTLFKSMDKAAQKKIKEEVLECIEEIEHNRATTEQNLKLIPTEMAELAEKIENGEKTIDNCEKMIKWSHQCPVHERKKRSTQKIKSAAEKKKIESIIESECAPRQSDLEDEQTKLQLASVKDKIWIKKAHEQVWF